MSTEKFIRAKQNPGAVLNTDNSALDAYKKRREKDRRMDMVEQDVKTLKQDLRDIKALLQLLAEKQNR